MTGRGLTTQPGGPAPAVAHSPGGNSDLLSPSGSPPARTGGCGRGRGPSQVRRSKAGDDWESETRPGSEPTEARSLRDEINESNLGASQQARLERAGPVHACQGRA